MKESELVTYKNLRIGQEITGTAGDGCSRGFRAYVKSINPAFVTVELWRKGGEEERINSSLMFEVEMPKEEFQEKYHEKAREVLTGIQNRLHGDEIGYHEMWNAWLYGTPYEIAKECVKNNMRVIGHSFDITPKHAMFSGDLLDVGVCAEYEDGERFWCHFRSQDIKEMVEEYKGLIQKQKDGEMDNG